jgi:hypothetical protein
MDESMQKALFDELIGVLHVRGLSREIGSIPDLIEYIHGYLIPNIEAYKTNIEGIMVNPALKREFTVEEAKGLAAELERVREAWTKDTISWIDRTSGINGLYLAVRTLFTEDFIPKFKDIISELKKTPQNIGPERFAFLQKLEGKFRPLEVTLKTLYKETKAEDDKFVAFIKTVKKSGRNTGRGIVNAEKERRNAIIAQQIAALNAEQARINAARAAVRQGKEVSNAELLAAKNIYNVESNTEETRIPALQRKAEKDRIAAEEAARALAAAEEEARAARASNSQNVNMNALNREHERLRKAAENAADAARKSARKAAKRGHLAALNNSNSNLSGAEEGEGGAAGGRGAPVNLRAFPAAAPPAAAPPAPVMAPAAPEYGAGAAAGGWNRPQAAAAPAPASPVYGARTPPMAPGSPAYGAAPASPGYAATYGPAANAGGAGAAAAPAYVPPVEITKEQADTKRAEAMAFYEENKEMIEEDDDVKAAYKAATSKTIKAAKTIYDRSQVLIDVIQRALELAAVGNNGNGNNNGNSQGGGRRRRKTYKRKDAKKSKTRKH